MAQAGGRIIIPGLNSDPIVVPLAFSPTCVYVKASPATGPMKSFGVLTPPNVQARHVEEFESLPADFAGDDGSLFLVKETSGQQCQGAGAIGLNQFMITLGANTCVDPITLIWYAFN